MLIKDYNNYISLRGGIRSDLWDHRTVLTYSFVFVTIYEICIWCFVNDLFAACVDGMYGRYSVCGCKRPKVIDRYTVLMSIYKYVVGLINTRFYRSTEQHSFAFTLTISSYLRNLYLMLCKWFVCSLCGWDVWTELCTELFQQLLQ
jgi:hypothetical protein